MYELQYAGLVLLPWFLAQKSFRKFPDIISVSFTGPGLLTLIERLPCRYLLY